MDKAAKMDPCWMTSRHATRGNKPDAWAKLVDCVKSWANIAFSINKYIAGGVVWETFIGFLNLFLKRTAKPTALWLHTHTGLTSGSYSCLFFQNVKFTLFGVHNWTIIQLNDGTRCAAGLAVKNLSATMSSLEPFRNLFTASMMELCNLRICGY